MATADTAKLGEAHAPKEASRSAFLEFENDLKHLLIHERKDKAKHELPYFEAIAHLSNEDLTAFTVDDFVSVRHAEVAYGHILFGKLRIPAMPETGPCYIHFRAFEPGPEEGKTAEVHSLHTIRAELPDGGFSYKAVFAKDDPLEWFDT
ncbi:hypothetical protein PG996_001351 [Apiospora saccharicola]|uniref:Uncharacterized protein n=1 Tax=Apiospora saccharicola TaxID=335842 RepID=A0ABR1WGE4_9PEZI